MEEITMSSPAKNATVEPEGECSILITRMFNAPVELVFDAHTKCELIKRWMLGPEGWTMPVCEIDLRVGGKYRFIWKRETTGHEMKMGGEYREIEQPVRLVATEK